MSCVRWGSRKFLNTRVRYRLKLCLSINIKFTFALLLFISSRVEAVRLLITAKHHAISLLDAEST